MKTELVHPATLQVGDKILLFNIEYTVIENKKSNETFGYFKAINKGTQIAKIEYSTANLITFEPIESQKINWTQICKITL